MKTNLSTKLKNMRKSLNLSAESVIRKLKKLDLNYTVQSLYKWEQGKVIPNVNVIFALSKIYHCNISYLIDEKNVIYKDLTIKEIFLIKLFRNDFLFRSIVMQIIKRLKTY